MPSVWGVSMTDIDTGMALTDRNILLANPPGTPWTPSTDSNTCPVVGSYNTILHTTNGGTD